MEIFKYILSLVAYLPFQADLDFEPVRVADSEGRPIYSRMNTGDWWLDTQNQLSAGGMVVAVISASDKTPLTNFSGDQPAWPLYRPIGNIWNDIHGTPNQWSWILPGLIICPTKDANNIDEARHSTIGTVLSQLRHPDIPGPGLKWDCADGFQWQCYPPVAVWVGDDPEHIMVAQISCGSAGPMCEMHKSAPMGHSTCRPLNNSSDQHMYTELLEDNYIDVLHTLGARPIRNQFWQYPLCIVYRLWQPDELHRLLLGLVKDLLHWLLKYLKARNVKDQFDKQFILAPWSPALQRFSKPFDWLRSGTWQCKEIHGMIRTVAVNCTPIVVCSRDDGKTAAETASDEMVMGAVEALCQFCLFVSQQNHSDLSLKALDDALKRFYQKKGIFVQQNAGSSMCASIEPDRRQSLCQILIVRRQLSDWSAKSIKWHRLNTSLLINYSNIMTDNYCRKSELRQPVPEAYSLKNLP